MSGLPILGSHAPWSGGEVSTRIICVLAPNPSVMTLDGTNTWIVGTAEGDAVIIDPGPDDAEHLRAVLSLARERHARIREILLTHGHPDHSEGARTLHEMSGARVRALDPQHRCGDEGLAHGDVVDLGDVDVHVVGTPGHTSDSLSFLVPSDQALLTGDTVLGRGTTVVAWPDGNLADYLLSLADLRERALATEATILLPGHGPTLMDPAEVIAGYLEHRHQRLEQVRQAWLAGARTPDAVVAAVYSDIPAEVIPAALLSVRAQLDYLGSEPDSAAYAD